MLLAETHQKHLSLARDFQKKMWNISRDWHELIWTVKQSKRSSDEEEIQSHAEWNMLRWIEIKCRLNNSKSHRNNPNKKVSWDFSIHILCTIFVVTHPHPELHPHSYDCTPLTACEGSNRITARDNAICSCQQTKVFEDDNTRRKNIKLRIHLSCCQCLVQRWLSHFNGRSVKQKKNCFTQNSRDIEID